MKHLTAVVSACLFFLLAGHAAYGDDVDLKLKAPRTLFMQPAGMYRYSPVNIRVRAELEGTPEDAEKFYCLEEEWEWGDETESRYEPDCDPYEEGAELKRNYSASHTFRYPGNYTIWLRLQRSGDTIIAGKITVHIRGD